MNTDLRQSTRISVRVWSEGEWLSSETEWSTLLSESACDQLFLSWHWLTTWWECFGRTAGRELLILAAYRGSELVGLLPLYVAHGRRGRVLKVRSLQFVGSSWRDDAALNSSYATVIAEQRNRNEVHTALLAEMLQQKWTEFVVGFTDHAQAWADDLNRHSSRRPLFARIIEQSVSYQLDLSEGLDAYQAKLGQSTRRSVFNLRRRLYEAGSVRVECVKHDAVDGALSDMNALHLTRWNKPAYGGARLEFHRRLAATLAARGELAMSRIYLDDRPISVLYDIRKGSTQYNIKMGFDPRFEQAFSLGLIHLGLGIEAAAQAGVRTYDLLAGPGRVRDFKQNLAQHRRELATLHLVRGPMLSRLFRWNEARARRRELEATSGSSPDAR